MAKGAVNTRERKSLALDPDRLGMLGGAILAFVVLTVGLFVRQAEIVESIFRAGMAFALGYAAVFVFVYIVRNIMLAEYARRQLEEQERLDALRKKNSEATSGGTE